MYFEHRRQPLLTRRAYLWRLLRFVAMALAIVTVALAVGVLGYHYLEDMTWIDALLNASMILGGMGPVGELHTNAGKVFASLYALASGLVILAVFGVIVTPVFHRFQHRFHAELDDGSDSAPSTSSSQEGSAAPTAGSAPGAGPESR